jgi:hypothetical protein
MLTAIPTVEEITARVSATAYGSRLVENSFRGLLAEIIVGAALGPAWRVCSGGWAGWDFEHVDGCRLEIKQSAALQTWSNGGKPAPTRFDIRARSGHYEGGATWIPGVGRRAHVYVFCYHPVADLCADHRNPAQWRFYVVRADLLPAGKTVGLARVFGLAKKETLWANLAEAVEHARKG